MTVAHPYTSCEGRRAQRKCDALHNVATHDGLFSRNATDLPALSVRGSRGRWQQGRPAFFARMHMRSYAEHAAPTISQRRMHPRINSSKHTKLNGRNIKRTRASNSAFKPSASFSSPSASFSLHANQPSLSVLEGTVASRAKYSIVNAITQTISMAPNICVGSWSQHRREIGGAD